jgi:membrane protease YdiL (CAAX protease family)
MTTELPQAVVLPGNRMFPRRLAGGVSQPPWSGRAAAWVVLISFVAGKCIFRLEVDLLWTELVASLPMIGALWYLARRSGTSIGTVFGLLGGRVGKVLVSGILLFIFETLLGVATRGAFKGLGFATGNDGIREQAGETASSFFSFTDAIVWAPFCEELAFRGLLYTSLRTRLGVGSSAVITAAAFAGMHPVDSMAQAGILFVPAVLSSLWYERTRSLWPGIISHALCNLTVTAFWAG